jgi:hypothetical protein
MVPCLCLQVSPIVVVAGKQPSRPQVPAAFMSKVFPDAQQKQPVHLKFTVDGKDSTPPGELRSTSTAVHRPMRGPNGL